MPTRKHASEQGIQCKAGEPTYKASDTQLALHIIGDTGEPHSRAPLSGEQARVGVRVNMGCVSCACRNGRQGEHEVYPCAIPQWGSPIYKSLTEMTAAT